MTNSASSSIGRAPTRRLRLTARGRRLVAALVLFAALLAFGAVAAQPALASAIGQSHSADLEAVTVGPGETLWGIATAITDDRDVRDVVADIQALNDLDGGHIEPGQMLVLPADR